MILVRANTVAADPALADIPGATLHDSLRRHRATVADASAHGETRKNAAAAVARIEAELRRRERSDAF